MNNGNTSKWLVAMLFLYACASEPAAQVSPDKRAHHELIYDPGRMVVLLTGGSTPVNGGQSFTFYNDIWEYTSTGWHKVGTSGAPCSGMRMAFHTVRNQVFSLGAFLSNNSISTSFRALNNGTWTDLAANPEIKYVEGGLVYDEQRNRLVSFGGSGGGPGQLSAITWEWDGNEWQKSAATGPPGRQAFAMVYDAQRKVTVLFGGKGPNQTDFFGDTWEYNGSNWTQVAAEGPGARMAPGFCYDAKRGLLIIFGGFTGSESKGDTWSWNGMQWTKLADQGPSPRMMGYMAYDRSRDRVVLFGGRTVWPNDTNDTWEWDGSQWKQIAAK